MKIRLTRADKIELLKAVKDGVLDTNKIPDIVKEIADVEPFLELMIAATSGEYDEENEVINK